jgi:hypothetical protein
MTYLQDLLQSLFGLLLFIRLLAFLLVSLNEIAHLSLQLTKMPVLSLYHCYLAMGS